MLCSLTDFLKENEAKATAAVERCASESMREQEEVIKGVDTTCNLWTQRIKDAEDEHTLVQEALKHVSIPSPFPHLSLP